MEVVTGMRFAGKNLPSQSSLLSCHHLWYPHWSLLTFSSLPQMWKSTGADFAEVLKITNHLIIKLFLIIKVICFLTSYTLHKFHSSSPHISSLALAYHP